ncbi:MAG: type VI secretion system membrane subunit TssM [Rhodobacteraceae bacterium]|nr:type VI secretion system membrane subunit TssM [Paracoccaceae bacterium]
MIANLLRRIGGGTLTTLIVALAFSLLIWFLGPLIAIGGVHPWDSPISRLISIGIILLLALTVILILLLRRARRDKQMEEDIVESIDEDASEDDELVQAELSELKGKLKDALVTLRKSKLGKRSLYELPWYLIIGPPGAGKTTAIVNSGLNFPLSDRFGQGSIAGVGGTRNCDWWFTDNAVLIDTAGRYTTQDSDEAEDNAGWLGFLKLLKKNRSRQPINGAVIAISLSDLSLQDETTQKSHAAAIRRRLHELRETLGVRFPVYVLFTKSDLIAGFTEYFDNLGKEDREQVWGFTLPIPKKKSKTSPIADFDAEFALLVSQLNAQSLERMQQETDHQRRALISNFPSQVASVRSTARSFLEEVFQDNRFEKRHLLRGVYFTSGTQEGTPIDRLMMGMARTFGIGRQAIGKGMGSGRSYFLTRLFESVIFPEAGLVSADDKIERRYRWTKRVAIAAAVVCGLAVSGLWTRSYLGNSDLVAKAASSVDDYRVAAAQIPGSPIEDSDLPGVVPALNVLRAMPTNPAVGDPRPDRALTYGLYQGKVLGNQAALAYRAALNEHLLPRLLLRLEEQLQANMDNPDFLYEALKIYLMLGQQGPMSRELVQEWMVADWANAYRGDAREGLRDNLSDHLTTLLSAPMDKIDLNGPLVEQIQGIISEMPLAQRIYNGIINSAQARNLPKWRLTDIGGPAIARAIVRSSGKPLNEGIDGIYTYDGFNTVFLGEALGVATRIQGESWVLGERGANAQSEAVLAEMSRDVLGLYYTDFISHYDKMLGDIDIIPMESLSHAVEVTNVLSGPTSPLVNILTAIAEETKLTEERAPESIAAAAEGATAVAQLEAESALSSRNQRIIALLQQGAPVEDGEEPAKPGQFVEDRFSWLHDLVAEVDGQPSQLDELMGRLTEVYQDLNKLQPTGGVSPAGQNTTAIARFQEMANRMAGPIQRWSTQITTGSSGIAADGTRASINALWQSQVLPFCTQALGNRYPFTRNARADVAMADFVRLFAPNGMIDGFFNENLRKHVDTRSRPWAWKRVNDVDLGISAAVLQHFQYAAEIRDAFFGGGDTVNIRFQVTPYALQPEAREVTLEIDGQEVFFAHKTQRPTAITWPGSVGIARVTVQMKRRKAVHEIARDGPWAWFRLLNAAQLRNTSATDRVMVIFNPGGNFAQFQLQSGSVLNPFSLAALNKFSCPESF